MAEKYLYYTLSDLLPPGSHLAVNTGVGMSRGGILTVITEDGKITGQESVTDQELSLLLALLEDYPYHCPYEHLLAAMWNENVDVVRTRLNRAADHGTWDLEIRSIRNTMNRLRKKTNLLGIDHVAIIETGYMLVKLGEGRLSLGHARR